MKLIKQFQQLDHWSGHWGRHGVYNHGVGSSFAYTPDDSHNHIKFLYTELYLKTIYLNYVAEFDEFSTQGDNRAVRYRTAHLQWLLDNDVYTLNSMNEWQPDLRHWTPSSSARYPLRMKIPKPATDPETCNLIIYISPNHVLFLSGYGIHSNNESA